MSTPDLFLQIAALISYACGAGAVPVPRVNLIALGLFFQTLTLFVP